MEIIEQLERTKVETLNYFDLSVEDLRKTYGPDKWSIRFVLNHLADSESVLFYRIRRVISEPNQVIWFYDQDAWAKQLDYSGRPLELARNIYVSSREATIYYARFHYESGKEITFVHSLAGIKTLNELFDSVVEHNQGHVSDIKKALLFP